MLIVAWESLKLDYHQNIIKEIQNEFTQLGFEDFIHKWWKVDSILFDNSFIE
jgi:hypothetical protein